MEAHAQYLLHFCRLLRTECGVILSAEVTSFSFWSLCGPTRVRALFWLGTRRAILIQTSHASPCTVHFSASKLSRFYINWTIFVWSYFYHLMSKCIQNHHVRNHDSCYLSSLEQDLCMLSPQPHAALGCDLSGWFYGWPTLLFYFWKFIFINFIL